MKMNIKRINDNAIIPTYGSEDAAGFDLYALVDSDVLIKPFETAFVKTGICMEIPTGYVGLIYARSGLSCKKGLAPANKVGVIDCDYRGEIVVALYNQSNEDRIISTGDRIAQMVITPYMKISFNEVLELDETFRGEGGFGSTGSK